MQNPAGLHAASPGNVEILDGEQAGQQVVRPLVLTLQPPREYRIHPFPSSFLQAQATAMLKQMEWEAEVTGRKADVLQVTAPHPPPNTELDINGHRMSIQDMDTIRAERKRREEEKRLKKEHRAHEDAIAALLAALQGVKRTGGRGGGRGYTAKDVVVPVAHLHAVLKVIAQDRTKQTPTTPATPLPSPTVPVTTTTAAASAPSEVTAPVSAVPATPAVSATPAATPATAPATTPAPELAQLRQEFAAALQRAKEEAAAVTRQMTEKAVENAEGTQLLLEQLREEVRATKALAVDQVGVSTELQAVKKKAERAAKQATNALEAATATNLRVVTFEREEMEDIRLQLHNQKKEQQVIVKAISGVQSGAPAATQLAVRMELLEERVMQVTQAQDKAQDTSTRTASQQTQQAEELQSAYVKLHAWTTEVAAKATTASSTAEQLVEAHKRAEAAVPHLQEGLQEQGRRTQQAAADTVVVSAMAEEALKKAHQTDDRLTAAANRLSNEVNLLRSQAEEEAALARQRNHALEAKTKEALMQTQRGTANLVDAATIKFAAVDGEAQRIKEDQEQAMRHQCKHNGEVEAALEHVVSTHDRTEQQPPASHQQLKPLVQEAPPNLPQQKPTSAPSDNHDRSIARSAGEMPRATRMEQIADTFNRAKKIVTGPYSVGPKPQAKEGKGKGPTATKGTKSAGQPLITSFATVPRERNQDRQ